MFDLNDYSLRFITLENHLESFISMTPVIRIIHQILQSKLSLQLQKKRKDKHSKQIKHTIFSE